MSKWKKLILSGSNAALNSLTVNSGSITLEGGSIVVDLPGSIQAHSFQGLGFGSTFVGPGHIGSGAELTGSFSGSFIGDGSGLSGVVASAIRSIGITVDGGGSEITTGIKGEIIVPFSGTINGWYLTADQSGSIVIDVWKDTIANHPPTVADTITGTEKPTLSNARINYDTTLTSWTTSVNAEDVFRFRVDSVSTITRATLVIKITS